MLAGYLRTRLTRLPDRRAHQTPSRPVQRGFPQLARDSFQGPPLRPGEGQCHEESQEAVWRVNYKKTGEVVRNTVCIARRAINTSSGGRDMTHGYVERTSERCRGRDMAGDSQVGSIDRIPKYAK